MKKKNKITIKTKLEVIIAFIVFIFICIFDPRIRKAGRLET